MHRISAFAAKLRNVFIKLFFKETGECGPKKNSILKVKYEFMFFSFLHYHKTGQTAANDASLNEEF